MRLKIALYACESGEAEFFGFHYNGTQHAAFCSADAARAWWSGLGRDREYFYVTNAKGARVESFGGTAGHAHAIIEKLRAKEGK